MSRSAVDECKGAQNKSTKAHGIRDSTPREGKGLTNELHELIHVDHREEGEEVGTTDPGHEARDER